jgi:hypothetical protein
MYIGRPHNLHKLRYTYVQGANGTAARATYWGMECWELLLGMNEWVLGDFLTGATAPSCRCLRCTGQRQRAGLEPASQRTHSLPGAMHYPFGCSVTASTTFEINSDCYTVSTQLGVAQRVTNLPLRSFIFKRVHVM